jgi:hypothetical protein
VRTIRGVGQIDAELPQIGLQQIEQAPVVIDEQDAKRHGVKQMYQPPPAAVLRRDVDRREELLRRCLGGC